MEKTSQPIRGERLVLCFGSENAPGDNLALLLAKTVKIPGYRLLALHTPDAVLSYIGLEFVLLDVAQGIRKPTVLAGTDSLEATHRVSLHDFDIGFFAKLLSGLDPDLNLRIIAFPLGYSKEKAEKELAGLLKKAFATPGRA